MNTSILVTGASGNLGPTVTGRLVRDGYHIHAPVRNAETAERLTGPQLTAHPLDLTDEAAIEAYVQQLSATDDVAAAVLLAGGYAGGNLLETDGETLRDMFALNFETAYHPVRALLPVFERRGGGQFILVGSRPALQPADALGSVAYALSKSLIFRLAELINVYGKDRGITASVIVPSTIDTPDNRRYMPEADFTRWVQPEAIADTISFLLSASGRQLREGIFKLYNEA